MKNISPPPKISSSSTPSAGWLYNPLPHPAGDLTIFFSHPRPIGALPTDPIALDECDVDILVRDAKKILLVTATDCDNGDIGIAIDILKSKAEKLAPNFDFLKGKKYMFLFCYDPSGPCPWNGQNMMSELLKILPTDSDIIWGMSNRERNNRQTIKIAVANL